MSLLDRIKDVPVDEEGNEEGKEHPPLEAAGCLEAWVCYQQREQREDGSEVCAGCGRVLRQ